jgi:hypothetical protein
VDKRSTIYLALIVAMDAAERPLLSMAQNMYSTVYIRHLHDIEAQLTTDAGSEGSE